ncbi:hypothetical protein KI387_015486, partial [Taxus chinensis]
MARKENIAFVLVLALVALLLLGVQPAAAAISGKGNYPEGCIRKEPCPADSGAHCKMHKIPVLPCSCSEIKRCDPHASGCMETTIA